MESAAAREERLALVAEEFAERLRRGESPEIGDYARAHPDLAEDLEVILPPIRAIEAGKASRAEAEGAFASGLVTSELDGYRLGREIGRGGMGLVYEAVEVALDRPVALKVLPPSTFLDETTLRRFHQEGETASRLQHEHIVPLFAVGVEQGVRYQAMQRIEGVGLDRLVRALRGEGPATANDLATRVVDRLRADAAEAAGPAGWWKRLARIGLEAASALQCAHENGVLHRDVKPSNILVDVHGKTWVTDFGIAKRLDDAVLTSTGDFVGTLQYAAPEQLEGRAEVRSDVYGLGLTLRELLTLSSAFPGCDRKQVLHRLSEGPLPDPREVAPSLPRDLAVIVSKATAPLPQHRYASIEALAADLRRYLADLPIRARRISTPERLWRWGRRNPLAAGLWAATLFALLAAAGFGWIAFLRTRRAFDAERAANFRVRESLEKEREAVALSERNLGLSLQAFDDLFDAVAGRDHALRLDDDEFGEAPRVPELSARDLALLERLLRFYDQFAEENRGNARIQEERARALRRIGDIHRWRGAFDEAATAYRRALELRVGPESGRLEESARLEQALTHKSLALALVSRGDRMDAAKALHDAANLLGVQGEGPATVQRRYELARVHCAQASLWLLTQGVFSEMQVRRRRALPRPRLSPAGRQLDAALRIVVDLTGEDPDNPEFLLLLARTHRLLAQLLHYGGDATAATASADEAVALLEELSASFAEVPDYLFELIETHAIAGSLHPDPAQAVARGREAVARARKATEDHPTAHRFQDAQARSLRRLGHTLAREGRHDEALSSLVASADLRQELLDRNPESGQDFIELVTTRRAQARSERVLGRIDAARKTLVKTIRLVESLPTDDPARRFGRSMPLSILRRDLAMIERGPRFPGPRGRRGRARSRR